VSFFAAAVSRSINKIEVCAAASEFVRLDLRFGKGSLAAVSAFCRASASNATRSASNPARFADSARPRHLLACASLCLFEHALAWCPLTSAMAACYGDRQKQTREQTLDRRSGTLIACSPRSTKLMGHADSQQRLGEEQQSANHDNSRSPCRPDHRETHKSVSPEIGSAFGWRANGISIAARRRGLAGEGRAEWRQRPRRKRRKINLPKEIILIRKPFPLEGGGACVCRFGRPCLDRSGE